ncbi:MAG: YraN family protein [Clostridia bacterium]|jgi:putative endonuclease|nr:YraN family protein [Clostridia bacterium]
MSKDKNKAKGDFGERLAARELVKKGYEIVKRNYRKRDGEIDIIAKKDNLIVFVEVKLRLGTQNGMPSEAVDAKKQMKIIETAKNFISEKNISDFEFRFDVIEILVLEKIYIRHIENAFWE